MLKKIIKYTDFNDEEVVEEHHFHLSKADLVEMEVSFDGGLSKALTEIIKSEDGKMIIATFKKLVLDSYGQKSDDGKRFVKNDYLREKFASSEAYSTLFMELVTDAEKAAEFVNGIIPKGMEADVSKITGKEDPIPVLSNTGKVPDPEPIHEEYTDADAVGTGNLRATRTEAMLTRPEAQRVLTPDDVRSMPSEELKSLLATGKARLSSSDW